jgi:competence protein ComEC
MIAVGAGVGLLVLPDAFPLWLPLNLFSGALVLICLLLTAGLFPSAGLRASARRLLRLTPWLLLGYLYGHWQMGKALDGRLPLCADARVRGFEVEILDHPLVDPGVVEGAGTIARFRGRVVVPAADDCRLAGPYEVRLSWYDAPDIQRGERWQVEGRLRPPWGNLNPGGFDYERWLLGQGLAGTGYIRDGRRLLAAPMAPDPREKIRAYLNDWVRSRKPDHAGIILALMTGDDTALSRSDWRLLRDSGTVHLLVVSGLHVGMVSGCLFLVGTLLARISARILLRAGARRFAATFALLGSGVFVWISGAGVPALRAWLMSAMVLIALMSGRTVRALTVVGVVMAGLLLSSPLVVHQQGFWLSFAAVLALVAFFEPVPSAAGAVSEKAGHHPGWRRVLFLFLLVQLVLLFALSPLLASFQGGAPLQSPLINALVVPLVAFAALPLILLAALTLPVPVLADCLLAIADTTLALVMTLIGAAARYEALPMGLAGIGQWSLMLTLLGSLSRRPAPGPLTLLVLLWWALLLPDGRRPPAPGEFTVTALDVGQGSAILVDTHRRRLIYDTGPRFASGFDLGDAAVIPTFRRSRNRTLSGLVLSHDDLDHTGGAASVVAALQPQQVWASFELQESLSGASSAACEAGVSWEWDDVRFEFLHPPARWRGSDNDRSCVLHISNGRSAALLAGDISRRVESRLEKWSVDLLMAPHHGSRTSSSPGFVRGFDPGVVFVSTDRRSRYGHPHPDVLERYAESRVLVTGRAGALHWSSREPHKARGWRTDQGAYWHRTILSPGEGRCPACG